MNYLFQNEPEHNKKIQEFGCKYITLLSIYQEITNYQILPELINAVYTHANRSFYLDDKGNEKPYMTKDCFVNKTSGIIQLVSGFTEIEVYMQEVSKGEKFNYRLGYFDRTTNGGKYVGHFVRVDLDTDNVTRDPWKGGSKTARIGILQSFRYIKARLL